MLVKDTDDNRKVKKVEKSKDEEEMQIFTESPFQSMFTEELKREGNFGPSRKEKLTVITD